MDLISAGLPAECVLFAEDASRVLVTCDLTKVRAIEESAVKYGLNAQHIGVTTGEKFTIRIDGAPVIEGEASAFKQSWRQALEAGAAERAGACTRLKSCVAADAQRRSMMFRESFRLRTRHGSGRAIAFDRAPAHTDVQGG